MPRALGIGIAMPFGGSLWSPARLFGSSEVGAWYDPSDFSTMFQDSTGTTPVTAVEQSVGRINDKSGNGYNATQSTAASRPVLSARYNLLTYSEQFDNAAWGKANVTVSANAAVAPDGTTTADNLITAAGTSTHSSRSAAQAVSVILSTAGVYTLSVYAKANGLQYLNAGLHNSSGITMTVTFDLNAGTVAASGHHPGAGTISSTSIASVGNGWWRCVATFTINAGWVSVAAVAGSSAYGGTYNRDTTGDGTSGVYVWGADLRVSSESSAIPAYQRIAAATDYDTVGFPPYLSFDGTDDFLVTGGINPGSVDRAQVFAGLRKLSDAAQGCVAEFSATIASNNGTFLLAAPDGATATFGFDSKGTTQVDAVAASQTAPLTAVVSGLADIAGDTATIRVNGAQSDQDTGDQGTGNFGTYAMYVGRRAGTSLPFNGRLYSLIARFSSANLDADTISAAETWVAAKTGVTL